MNDLRAHVIARLKTGWTSEQIACQLVYDGPLPQPARKSITFDRGFEVRAWRRLKSGIGAEAWFCDPKAPWQKGSVENLNKRARPYLPRDTQLAAFSSRTMRAI
ncbi:IS30 family transposase [Sagittula marina]|uniref:IS30 family transposase n=1 Tax=Sagittula marina TaxID=943940 RepID=A0A7W6GTZ3_9RHOB|nr:IS30 family transposase [Sagittula marina]